MAAYSAQVRVKKLNDYLVGDGFFSNIPVRDAWFYRLAGLCSGHAWPTNPCRWKDQINNHEGSDEKQKSQALNKGGENGEPITAFEGNLEIQTMNDLFRPRPILPVPIDQQTYRKWKSSMDMMFQLRRIRKRPRLCIQPMDDFPTFISDLPFNNGKQKGFFLLLSEFMKIFFCGFDVKLLPPVDTSDWQIKRRNHRLTGNPQLLVDDVITNLSKSMDKDTVSMIGITYTDLYPSEELNFVLGQGSSYHHAGVVCFGRFEYKLYEQGITPPPITRVDGELIFKLFKSIVHETCHTFHLAHCVFFDCLMNESTSVVEAMNQSLFLCPVCLRKLQKVCKFDILERYKCLLEILQSIQAEFPSVYFRKSISWLECCLKLSDLKSDPKS